MGYDVSINRQGVSAIFDIKGSRDAVSKWVGAGLPAFPATPNTHTQQDARTLMYIGPNHWLLRSVIEDEPALDGLLRPDQAPADISIVRVSDTLTFFSINGPDAGDIMAIASPLDTDQSVFARNAATYSEAFGVKALVLRKSDGFELAVEQSFGNMIADYLSRATA